jgi:deazaflavin-dependent oxidoreductase (nitroreductase family)
VRREPFAARLYFVPLAVKPVQEAIVRMLRRYVERAPGWVLLTTRGRKTGLPREVLLPCERTEDAVIVISTYGWRSQWVRNIREESRVRVTCGAWVLEGRAEIIEDPDRRREIVTAHPFFPPAPFGPVHLVLRTILRPLLVWMLRRWVGPRPIVVIHRERAEGT